MNWLPPFVEEMRREVNRPRLLAGVWSGYLIAIAFAVLAAAAVLFDVAPYGREFLVLLLIKASTNTLALVALTRRWRIGLELMSLNTTADVVLMTAAIYFTGGVQSPLFAVYVIEIAVLSLLSNLATTMLIAGLILIAYGTMCVLELTGTLAPTDPPFRDGIVRSWQVVVVLGFAAFAIGVPTFFTSRVLRRLRDREAQLEARTAELLEAGKQKSVFLASVTHELRTPIHGVQGLSDLIASGVYGPTTDRQREAAAAIKRSAQSLLHLVDDVLALVKAEVGRVEVYATEFALRDVIEQVSASVGWMLGTKRLGMTTEIVDATVITDRRLLSHILVNLVANAAKFTPEGGRVEIAARVDGQEIRLAVTDTGIGIPAEQLAIIFEPFRQVDGSDERSYGGAGLGLALVKRLTDALGGTVAVTSTVDRGSTFTVTIPLRSAADRVELAGQRQAIEAAQLVE
jgi:signal transduction histidine kinase